MLKLNKILLVSVTAATLIFYPGLASARPGSVSSISAKLNNIIGRHAVLTGVQLTSMTGSSLSVTLAGQTYTITTDNHTVFRRRFWGKAVLSEMSAGDTLNIFGKWTDTAKTTILANLIRDTSIQKRNAVFIGTITAVNGNTWTINTVARGTQTATVTSSAKFINRKEQTISQSDILVGHRIRIRGMWDNLANTITEITAIKDFSLPVKTTPTPTP